MKALAEACNTFPTLSMDAILRANAWEYRQHRSEYWEFQVLRVWHNQTKWWFVTRYELTREKIAERRAETTKRWGVSAPMYKRFGTGTGDRGLDDVCKWKNGKGGKYANYGGAAGSGAAQSSY